MTDSSSFSKSYNPDVLCCLANLSSDEVFTPPDIANAMLDLLPQELFQSPDTKFLDPCCKSGVFLREIAKRLIKGLEPVFPDLQERLNHIFKNQLFGIAITTLTSLISRRSLYCSKDADSEYSVVHFDSPEGNIRFSAVSSRHKWYDGRCIFCGATKEIYERDSNLESYAYEMIHTNTPQEIFNMKFDVVIGNPPYQLKVGVKQKNYAVPIYHKFVEQAKKLNPRFLTMIIPAKWYTGGRGLDEFRSSMLGDKHVIALVDYPNPYDCFQGVDNPGGICYFLWSRDQEGECAFTSIIGDTKQTVNRILDENHVFIRDVVGLKVINKIKSLKINNGRMMDSVVSSQTPYGIITSYTPVEFGTPCWFKQKTGLKYVRTCDVRDISGDIDKYKLLIPEAPIAGQTDFTKPVGLYYEGNTIVAKPGECCTQTWLVANVFDSEEETLFFRSYLLTKIVRFLILQTVVSQHVSRDRFCFVPDLGKYEFVYTDEFLRKEWGISDDEWQYIDSKIHNYGGN